MGRSSSAGNAEGRRLLAQLLRRASGRRRALGLVVSSLADMVERLTAVLGPIWATPHAARSATAAASISGTSRSPETGPDGRPGIPLPGRRLAISRDARRSLLPFSRSPPAVRHRRPHRPRPWRSRAPQRAPVRPRRTATVTRSSGRRRPAVNVVLNAQWALYQVLTRLGLRPDAVVGHSSGEMLALAAAGVIQSDRELEAAAGPARGHLQRLRVGGRVAPGATRGRRRRQRPGRVGDPRAGCLRGQRRDRQLPASGRRWPGRRPRSSGSSFACASRTSCSRTCRSRGPITRRASAPSSARSRTPSHG